jgi:hypothetical protein
VAVKTAGDHTCAQTDLGDLFCWGRDDRGQVGDGTTIDSATPTRVVGSLPVDSGLAAPVSGDEFTCVGDVYSSILNCWGELAFAAHLGRDRVVLEHAGHGQLHHPVHVRPRRRRQSHLHDGG